MTVNQGINRIRQVLHGCNFEIEAFKNLITALINNFALFVHDLVVLQNVLANFSVALLDCALRTLNCFGHHFCFNCFVIGKRFAHDPTEGTRCKQAHEFVVETEIKAAFTGIALTTCATTQLIIDTA